MTGSYKIALLAAGLLCALVVGYYAIPEGGDARVSTDDTAESADDATAEPRSLVRGNRSGSSQQQSQSRPTGGGDEMSPFEEADASSQDDEQISPPNEDPGAGGDYDDEPVLPVARNARSLQANPYDTMDVTEPDAASNDDDQADDEDDEDETERRPSPRTLTLGGTTSEEESASASDSQAQADSDSDSDDADESSSTSTASSAGETYTVKSGDTLSSIAQDLYGAERHWVDLARANPRIDPVRLRIGQELRLPDREAVQQRSSTSDEDDDLESPPGTLTHIVRPGETLSTIAQKHYNDSSRWRTIFNANRDKLGADPDRLSAGDELTIPPLPRN